MLDRDPWGPFDRVLRGDACRKHSTRGLRGAVYRRVLELLWLLLASKAFTKGTTVASQQVQAAGNGVRSTSTRTSGICGSEDE